MGDAWLRRIVMAAIVLLVLHAVGAWVYAALGVGAAVASAVLIAAVSMFSARMAGRGSNAWFVVPTLLFTVLPLAARLWNLFAVEQSGWSRMVEFTPFLVGFAGPVALLLITYVALGTKKRTPGGVLSD